MTRDERAAVCYAAGKSNAQGCYYGAFAWDEIPEFVRSEIGPVRIPQDIAESINRRTKPVADKATARLLSALPDNRPPVVGFHISESARAALKRGDF
jgi:hypothetical protein